MNSTKSTALTHCKQWWRSTNKKILLLLVWQALFKISWGIRESGLCMEHLYQPIRTFSQFISFLSTPFAIWLAEKMFGRYKMVKFGSMISFTTSILSCIHNFCKKNQLPAQLCYSIAHLAVMRMHVFF